ncbi:MAG: deoxyribose-phosphate aldolase [Treponema sp.]|nr:deoxyribose-phosphate aldolase [Treponema sp.]
MNKEDIASIIDHTILTPEATESQIVTLCDEAKKHAFASVCINPIYVKLASACLKDSSVKVCTVVGFPLGATPSKNKADEAVNAIQDGASEIDMVIHIASAKEGKFDLVQSDIAEVVSACKKVKSDVVVKVILETCFLTDSEIIECCKSAINAGAHFVKTSTGFATPKDKDGNLLPNGATEHHVKIMRETVGNDFGVKASGGIRSAESARAMVNAGASRIGTSSGVKIISDWQ